MLLEMAKVEIIGPKNMFYDVLSVLHEVGTLHIEDLSKRISPGSSLVRKMELDTETLESRNALHNLLVRVNSISASVAPEESLDMSEVERARLYNDIWRDEVDDFKGEVDEMVAELEDKTRDLATKKSEMELELASLAKYETILDKIQPLVKDLVTLEGFETVALLIERKHKAVLDIIRKEMGRITKDQFEIVSTDVDEDTTAALIVFNKTYSEPVHSFLWAENVNQVRLPEELANEPFDIAVKKLRDRRLALPPELDKIKGRLAEISEGWFKRLTVVRDVLNDRIQQLEMVGNFGQTDYTFVIEGWIPLKRVKGIKKALHQSFGEKVIVDALEVREEDREEAPIVFQNPAIVRPYEMVMQIFAPPKYGSIDPTPFLALFFPIFFGLIVADIGYGLMFLGVALWLRFRYRTSEIIRAVTTIVMMASLSTIMFGFVFGEFFGDTLETRHLIRFINIGGLEVPLNRTNPNVVIGLMIVCLAMGAAHILLGLALGVVNALRAKSKHHAMEKGGMFGFLMTFILLIGTYILWQDTPIWRIGQYPLGVLLLLSVVLLIRGGGGLAAIEVISLFSNVASYIRIMALGLAGVILAMVANKIGGMMGSAVLGVLIAMLIHALNLVVSAFSPTIHALRLNMIEFFGKFYETGGKAYKPFKKAGGA